MEQSIYIKQIYPYFIATRPKLFAASFGSLVLGSCLAYKESGNLSLYLFMANCITTISVHAAGNLVNTYYDYLRSFERAQQSRDRTLVDNILNTDDVVWLVTICYLTACLGFAFCLALSKASVGLLSIIYFGGLSGSFLYTGGLGLKYIAVGDVIIFLTFGPITALFAFVLQSGELRNAAPLVYAIPLALTAVAIIHAKNCRDAAADRSAGFLTMAILLGPGGSYLMLMALLFAPLMCFVCVAIFERITHFLLPAAVCAALAFPIDHKYRAGNLRDIPNDVGRLNALVALAYSLAVYSAPRLPLLDTA